MASFYAAEQKEEEKNEALTGTSTKLVVGSSVQLAAGHNSSRNQLCGSGAYQC